MNSLEDFRWLDTLEAQTHWNRIACDPTANANTQLKTLRASLPIEKASLLMGQWELLSLSSRKVAAPSRWFWTRQLLEQATDQETARETAKDFAPRSRVFDICSGAGVDAISMAESGIDITAIDRCPIAAHLTRRNARAHSIHLDVCESDAEQVTLDKNSFIHIDPDRRAEGRRTNSLERISPSWSTIRNMLDHSAGLSLKLAPGLRIPWREMLLQCDRPPESIRFLAKEGSVRQQRWYWGIPRWPHDSITASILLNQPAALKAAAFQRLLQSDPSTNTSQEKTANREWFHETFFRSALLSSHYDILTETVGEYVADYDPSIRAAELAPSFASRYSWQLVHSESGYLTASEPRVHPMVRWFHVEVVLPMDRKKLKAFAKQSKVRNWELKSRGIDVDLDEMRKMLPSDSQSDRNLTILLTRTNKQHLAIVCSEVT